MKTIYKYPLQVTDIQKILMPVYAQILSVQAQNNQLVLWAVVETEAPTTHRTILK